MHKMYVFISATNPLKCYVQFKTIPTMSEKIQKQILLNCIAPSGLT